MEINLKISFLLPAAFMLLLAACGGGSQIADTPTPETKVPPTATPTATPTPTPSPAPTSVQGVPLTSASAITSPPLKMEGINTHIEMYGTGADPNIITLGPKVGGHPGWEPYLNKTSMEFELNHGVPVLAPIDMVLVGFKNQSAEYRIRSDGQRQTPYNDLLLYFESASSDWPGMIIGSYHLLSSPLLPGHNQNPGCSEIEEWGSRMQAQGHMFLPKEDRVMDPTGDALSCDALIGYTVKRGELIGFAGSVGTHSMAPFRFKVSHTSENPTVKRETAIFIGFSQAHSSIGNVMVQARNFPVGYLLILSSVEGINFQQNNMIPISSTLQRNS